MNKVAMIFIGTNQYLDFFDLYYESAMKNFLPNTEKDFFVFSNISDRESLNRDNVNFYFIPHLGWPFITLYRFKFILEAKEELLTYTHLIYIDADMFVNQLITEEEFFCHDKAFFGVQHPAFINKIGTFEFGLESTAGVKKTDDLSMYWQGCFWGGRIPEVFELIKKLDTNIDQDAENQVMAVWHDESHLNKFFIENKKHVYTYDAGFAYPEKWNIPFERKIIHIEKNDSEYQI